MATKSYAVGSGASPIAHIRVPAGNAWHTNYSFNGYLAYDPFTDETFSYWYKDRDVHKQSGTVVIVDGVFTSTGIIKQQSANPWYQRDVNLNRPTDYFHCQIGGSGGLRDAVFADGHTASFRWPGVKSGWFKIREFWKDTEISSNQPTGP